MKNQTQGHLGPMVIKIIRHIKRIRLFNTLPLKMFIFLGNTIKPKGVAACL